MQSRTGFWRGIGRIPLLPVVGIALVLLALAADATTAVAESGPAALHGDFAISKNGRFILLPVHAADREILCLLDTGAGLSAFDVTLRKLLGAPQPARLVDAPGGRARVETFAWPQIKLGEQTISSSKPVACIDLENVRRASDSQVYGVIGMDVLATSRLQIDFDRGVLKFLDRIDPTREELGHRIPLRIAEDGTPHLFGAIDETREEQFLIDTGAQGNSLAIDIFDELVDQGRIRLGASFASTTIAGETRGERGRLDRVTFGPFTHKQLRFSRVRMSSLGLRFLSRFRVLLDFPGKCLYLQPGMQFQKSEPRATSGLMLKWIDGEVRVDGVRENGPAASVGVKAGDVLLRIDGKSARSYDYFALRELLMSTGGKVVPLTVRRDKRHLDFELVLNED
jgi:hypothetical protein